MDDLEAVLTSMNSLSMSSVKIKEKNVKNFIQKEVTRKLSNMYQESISTGLHLSGNISHRL